MISLDDYLDEASRQPWAFGSMDCVQFALGWARARAQRELSAPLAYRGVKEARAFLAAHGGLLELVSQWMAANGFPATLEPEDGDIGVALAIMPLRHLALEPARRPALEQLEVAGGCVVIRRGPWWIGKGLYPGFASVMVQGEIPAWRIS